MSMIDEPGEREITVYEVDRATAVIFALLLGAGSGVAITSLFWGLVICG